MKIKWALGWIESLAETLLLEFRNRAQAAGKTTELKILIGKLLEGRDPKEVICFNCDLP